MLCVLCIVCVIVWVCVFCVVCMYNYVYYIRIKVLFISPSLPIALQIVEAVTLTEIFRDNAHLCSKVTEAEVQHFINCTEKARNVKYIQFLQTVVVGAKGNRRVQEMVMNEVGVAL